MEAYHINNLTFNYPNEDRVALDNINLTINRGDFCILCGPSCGGKTTLLRHLKLSTTPHGVKTGTILFEGQPIASLSTHDAAKRIGFVSQSPERQIVTEKVWQELAFGLENLGENTPTIRLRVAETASYLGIQAWFNADVATLSGGQKQRLVIGAILVMQPDVLILDEPTSQLDPIAAEECFILLAKINRELGITIILTEHRMEEVFPYATKIILLESGRIIKEGMPREAARNLNLYAPTPAKIAKSELLPPISVKEGRKWLAKQVIKPQSTPRATVTINNPALVMDEVFYKYEKNAPFILKGASLTAHYGEIFAILGSNGTGKSTAMMVASGVYKPQSGKIVVNNKIAMLPQNPQLLFVTNTVCKELLTMPASPSCMQKIIHQCQLSDLLDKHPYDLSGGEQQRVALAKILLLQPKILLLDEPTQGLDIVYKQALASILRNLANAGTAVVLVSHDIEFCASFTDRCALFFDGTVIIETTTHDFFAGNFFYTTVANRIARGILPNAVTVDDIIASIY